MSPPVQPGQVIKGKYQIDRVLGEGGMGVVVAGHHVGLGQRVAIKFLQSAMLQHPEVVERFAREARAASKLESDHVARVTDVDTMADGTPFMVMEYLEGQDLSTVRASGQPLPLAAAVGYILEACEAFGEAHSVGIVHRDIKPANLFLAKRGGGKTRVKVLDFGISKMGGSTESDAAVTRTSSVMGSAHYMSPEQMLTPREVDHRTDIWALGVTLFELTTARLPFPGESVTQVCAMIMATQPPSPSSVNGALPPGFDAVVLKCLGRHPNERYGTVAELAEALAPFAASSAPSFGRAPAPAPSFPGAVPGVTSPPVTDPGPAWHARSTPMGSDPLAVTPMMQRLPGVASWPQQSSPSQPVHSASQPVHSASQPVHSGPYPSQSGPYPSQSAQHPSQSAQHPSQSTPYASHPDHGAPATVLQTAAPVSRTDATPKATSKAPMIFGVVALSALLLGGTAAALIYKSGTSAASSSDAPASATPTAPDTPRASASDRSPTAPPTESSAVPARPPTSASAAAAPPNTTRPTTPSRPGTKSLDPVPPPAKKPAANCNPPFTVDAQGVKRAKPECL